MQLFTAVLAQTGVNCVFVGGGSVYYLCQDVVTGCQWDYLLKGGVIHELQLRPSDLTILVFDMRASSAPQQLEGTLLLASIGSTVQRGVTQQICAVDVWWFLHAQLRRTHRKKRTDVFGQAHCKSYIFCGGLRHEALISHSV